MRNSALFGLAACLLSPCFLKAEELDPPYQAKTVPGVDKIRLLPPTPENPRNSEGDFIELRDGTLLFIYTHFTGGGSDHAAGHLASRESRDGGKTWTEEDKLVIEREGDFNNMSVSLLRLQSGDIALFYLIKNSLQDCRPFLRISKDEAKTWSEPIPCITDEIGYYVLNNDRVIQLPDGRLLFAVAKHSVPGSEVLNFKGEIITYYSDDQGTTWSRGKTTLQPEVTESNQRVYQEPGLVLLRDGSILMFIRTNAGAQLFSYSKDRGETWTEPTMSPLSSPTSPATIERIPSTGDLLAVWNDHSSIPDEWKGKRTPLSLAISKDEGKTWIRNRTLEDDPNGWYCYTAMDFVDGHIVLGHCAGDRRKGGLNLTQVTRFPIAWIYEGQ